MTAQDALAAAIYMDQIITSPNCPYIPMPLTSPRQVQLRSDLRFGADDAIQYPQWIRSGTQHHLMIQSKSLNPEKEVMWWDGARASFVQAADVAIGGVGLIQAPEMDKMAEFKTDLSIVVSAVLQSSASPLSTGERDSLRLYHSQMLKAWERLCEYPDDIEEKCLQVIEFQRSWLELQAVHLWVTRVRNDLMNKTEPPRNTWRTIGGFTTNIKEVQDCMNAGVPVFFVRPQSAVKGPMRIDNVVPLTMPQSQVVETLDPNRQTIIFNGDPMLAEHHQRQLGWLRNRHLPQIMITNSFDSAEQDRSASTGTRSGSSSAGTTSTRSSE